MCKHCWGDTESEHHKDWIRGGVDADHGEAEVNYKPKKKKPGASKKKYPGCPGNEGKAHVYVWTTEKNEEDLFFRYYGFYRSEYKICAGCGHKDASRLSEKYLARKEKMFRKEPRKRYFRYYAWEYSDEEYQAYRRKHISMYGWTKAALGEYW